MGVSCPPDFSLSAVHITHREASHHAVFVNCVITLTKSHSVLFFQWPLGKSLHYTYTHGMASHSRPPESPLAAVDHSCDLKIVLSYTSYMLGSCFATSTCCCYAESAPRCYQYSFAMTCRYDDKPCPDQFAGNVRTKYRCWM